MPKKPGDVGAAWKKSNNLGEYISVALDLEELLALTGGVVGKVNLNLYPIISDNPKAPDYQVKYYPPKGAQTTKPAPPPDDDDDSIPF
jgi:uncharacterized protein (DUF736 family)